ncbi:MAG: UDP-4-amino-4,6-dideoxy-N-acetyl-beta-L-altrosamine transaminase [Peptococcaceae bacterium]|nr:UDP-4-amino-4,6-dideoxy-N-acetyl-beta-L-altrosamine transaminase [Peptococcaceae bacterium]
MEKLALYGGTPVRETPIYYGRHFIDEEDCKAVQGVLLSDFLTTGPKISELEQKLCELTGAKYAVAIANGTAALHAACFVAGIKQGDEVITTPLTFAASANCVLYCGGMPVFADIDDETYTLSPASLRECVTSWTKAVIAVDFAGQAAQVDEIRQICHEQGLVFIEDGAHSLGTKFNGRPVGSLADMTTFSFHPVKTVTGGEGGAVLTSDEELYKKLKLFRTHGITRNLDEMDPRNGMSREPEGSWYYEQIGLGYNYRMTDIQAALIRSQLDKLDRFAARRKAIVERYREALAEMPEIILPREIPQSDTVWHLYVIQLNLERLMCSRRVFFDAMAAENVVPNVHYIPLYFMPYYQKLGYEKGLCPKAEHVYERILSIPLYYSMTDDDVDSVIRALDKVVSYFRV